MNDLDIDAWFAEAKAKADAMTEEERQALRVKNWERRDEEEDAKTLRRHELWKAARELGEDFTFEVVDHGHTLYFNGDYSEFSPDDLIRCLEEDYIFNDHSARGLLRAWTEDKPITELTFGMTPEGRFAQEGEEVRSTHRYHPLPFSLSRYSGHEKCRFCQCRDFYTDGFKIWPDYTCPAPNGIPVKVEIPIPSGKILVANDIREEFGYVENGELSDSTTGSLADVCNAYADIGMAHFYVGNTCPGIYRNVQNHSRLVIANPIRSDSDDPIAIPGFQPKSVASVCTDLWWVCMVDLDEAVKRGIDPTISHYYDVVDVEPGTYVLEWHGAEKSFECDSDMRKENPQPVIYADFYRKEDQ